MFYAEFYLNKHQNASFLIVACFQNFLGKFNTP